MVKQLRTKRIFQSFKFFWTFYYSNP